MIRKILGVIVGYIVMVIFIMLTFSLVYILMGADRAYLPGTYDVSMLWIGVSAILGLIAAIIGGFVCKLISKSGMAIKVFAGLVIFFGVIIGVMQMISPKPDVVREGAVSNAEAMQKSRQPTWVAILNPVLGTIGILVGGGLRKSEDELS